MPGEGSIDAAADHPALSGYEVVSELGSGGFGQVLLARHRQLGRLVAVKQIHAALLADGDAVQRFRREAVALARLKHPAVVAIYDLQITDRSAVMLMEYVPGESLQHALDTRVVPPAVAISILADVADALAAAATVGVVHRDVKPGNVFLLSGGRAKLGDFGISRIADPAIFRTSNGITGTPAYMAPESFEQGHEPDRHTDDYAFAVMAYEVLVGRRPFEGDALALLTQHEFSTPTSPADLVAGFPAAAAEALLAGLDKHPTRRLAAHDLVARLRAVAPAAWPAAPPPRQTDGAAGSATVLEVPTQQEVRPVPQLAVSQPRRRRPTRLAMAIGAAVLCAAAVAAVAIVTSGSDELSIVAATVTVDSTEGECPGARFVFTADIDTNGGAGTLRLRWLQPDGELTNAADIEVGEGQEQVVASLQFDVAGSTAMSGSAQVQVLSPQQRSAESVEISYTCP